jgi:micrococcal nuclease
VVPELSRGRVTGTPRLRRGVAAIIGSLVLVGCAPGSPPQPSEPDGVDAVAASSVPAGRVLTVSRVVDGDTVDASDDHSAVGRIRVLGIDTPETHDPRKPVQCWGPEASEFATGLLLDQPVTVVTDPSQDLRDRYDRLLAYLYLPDGRNYSVEAAAAGAARAYTYDHVPVREAPAINRAEHVARAARRGLWGPPCNGQP